MRLNFFALILIGSVIATVQAELKPYEIAILASANNRESQALAKYYAKQRAIPAAHICSVDLPTGEDLPRDVWERQVRPAIRQWISDAPFRDDLRCFVTVWGVPLRIGKADPSINAARKQFAVSELDRHLEALRATVQQAEQRASIESGDAEKNATDNESTKPGTDEAADKGPKDAIQAELEQLVARLEVALKKLQSDIQANQDSDERNRLGRELQQLIFRATGPTTYLESLSKVVQQQQANTPLKVRAEFDFYRGRLLGLNEGRQLVELQQLPSIATDQTTMYFIERLGGLTQTIRWLRELKDSVNKNETQASLDSELSLVLWPDYETLRWQNNYLHRRYDASLLRDTHPTMMVSRLDAPTLKLAKDLVDAALQAEAKGLSGKVYLDARGLTELKGPPVQPGSFQAFDRSLLALEAEIKTQGKLPVVLDTKPELFQPGACPEAALYCGWYSLAKYIDAFDWQPGAVAYHIASSEATTLKKPDSQVWCKRLLEDGVCATLGPVAEPYLQAFPPPDEFFSLLLQGDLTLVECYYRTKPYNSWMMALIGDPLYRPFGKN